MSTYWNLKPIGYNYVLTIIRYDKSDSMWCSDDPHFAAGMLFMQEALYSVTTVCKWCPSLDQLHVFSCELLPQGISCILSAGISF